LPVLILLAASAALIPRASSPAAAATAASRAEPFNEARIAELTAQKKPIFVYFTADWCLTCKVNEKAAIERAEVRAAFAKAGVVEMIGDWTNGDPAIGRFLEAKGRSGVPYYLFYHRDGTAEELPQLLTPAMLVAKAQAV
jgi:thiol:disulfide interchange protein